MASVLSKAKGHYDLEAIYRRDVMKIKEWGSV